MSISTINSSVKVGPLSVPEPPPWKKASKDNAIKKYTPHNFVTFVYQTKLGDSFRSVALTWCKNLIEHTLSMIVEKPFEEDKFTCKIDLASGQSWGKKGLKSFEIDGSRADLYWDFRQAKFSNSPQPCSGYYVALVYKKKVLLLLGDLEHDAYERTKSKPSLEESTLLCKKENVQGKTLFCTKAMLEEGKPEHDIVIETSLCGPDDPEMWISIDGILASRIMNLNWKFRGNEFVMVNNLPVQILWDVHDWLFNDLGSGPALFIFKPGFMEHTEINEDYSKHDLVDDTSTTKSFFHFLYAWKID